MALSDRSVSGSLDSEETALQGSTGLERHPYDFIFALGCSDYLQGAVTFLVLSNERKVNKEVIKCLEAPGLNRNICQILIAKKYLCTILTCKALEDQKEDKWQ